MDGALFLATIEKYQSLRHIHTKEALRAHTTVGSPNTFRKYLKDPELVPIGVFEEIMSALNVPMEEQLEIFKGKK